MKGDVTPIPKAEEGGEVMRAWQSEQPNWPCVPVLGGSPDTFFFLSSGWRVWKHPPHRHRGRTIYSFIVECGSPGREVKVMEEDTERNAENQENLQ